MKRAASLPLLLLAAAVLAGEPLNAQVSDRVLRATVGDYVPGEPLPVSIEFSNLAGIGDVTISYRLFGRGTWTVREMQIVGSTAAYAIPAAELGPSVLEYWFSFERTDGGADSTYPAMNPESQPLTADLSGARAEGPGGLVILSPESGEHINRDDLVISFALAEADSLVDPAGTKVSLDGEDLSEHVVASDGLFVVSPQNAGVTPDGGAHTVAAEVFDSAGVSRGRQTWSFFVRGPRLGPSAEDEGPRRWVTHGTAKLETRNETVSGVVTPYNRATLDARATDGRYEVTGHLHLTSEEKDSRQPQHRYFIGAESPWVRLGYGDTYPVMPDMIISGKRVRGVNGALSAGFFDFDVVAGDIVRNVEGDTIFTFPADSLAARQAADPDGIYGPYDESVSPVRWAKYRHGTFDRSMLILRPSFKFGNSVFGITALHSRDDVGSITYGGAPEENLVAGTDLTLSFDRRNIELRGQAGFSAYNSNIRGGTISDERLDSIFADTVYESFDREDLEDARDILSRFITVNENLVPLGAENMPTVSWETGLAVNYRPNQFNFTWLRHGASYVSFGQPFYRRDVEGFTATDRLLLADNRLQLSAGLERLEDNTAETKAATTTFTTLSGGASWLSRNDVPNISVGLLSMRNENPLDPAAASAVDDNTIRFMLNLSRQILLGPRHFASAGFSISNRDDNTLRDLDSRNTTVSLSVVTTYDIPLQTTASAMFFSTEIGPSAAPVSDLSYAILFFGGEYRLVDSRLTLNAAVSPTVGDIRRTLVDGGARYAFTRALSLEGRLDLYFFETADTDIIWSFVLRAGL